MIEVQILDPDDWPLWRQLRLEALAESGWAFSTALADWSGRGDTEQRWRARLSDFPLNIVLKLDDVPAGMVSAYVRDDGTVELTSMWVAPFARSRGVGDAAVQAIVKWADRRETVLSVKVDNEPAINLYRRHGFIATGRPPNNDLSEQLMYRPPIRGLVHVLLCADFLA